MTGTVERRLRLAMRPWHAKVRLAPDALAMLLQETNSLEQRNALLRYT